ncbi:MAG: hypothetical protein GXP62_14965 [Oligoflexia bacterium]|nr:hypothetical protein [Oligoflexia bacterium]
MPRPACSAWATAIICALTACTGTKDSGEKVGTTTDGGVVAGDGGDVGADDCGPNAPVVTDGPWCTYPGMDSPEGGLEEVPVLRVGVDVHDDDGDLHYRATRIYWDQDPFGKIDTDTAGIKERSLTLYSDRICEEPDGVDVGDKIYMQPDGWEYGADYDFGIQVSDAAGHWSDLAVITCTTPLKDGSEP